MIKCKVIKDFYYTETKEAYREGREYLFTEEQFKVLSQAGFVVSEEQKEIETKETTIKVTPKKNKKYKFKE